MSPEDQPPLDVAPLRPHQVIGRLHVHEYRAWSLAVPFAGAGIILMSLTFSDVGRLALYNAGVGCCVGSVILMATATILGHMRTLFAQFAASRERIEKQLTQIEATEGELLGAAEDELRHRRGRG